MQPLGRAHPAIKRSADGAQLDTVSYPLPIGVGRQSWSVQPSRQRQTRPVAERESRIASQRS
jgi:hypothetical protein